MMVPQWDGRVHVCPYCRTQVQVAIGGDQIAAGMAMDFANVDQFLLRLAWTLKQGFFEHARIQETGGWVTMLEVWLEPDQFVIRREGREAIAEHKKIVRGVALRTKKLPLEEWHAQLCEALAKHANANARAAWILKQIGGGTT
jgi:hypothetical protein